ncbi:hypothetical protein [Streptomyces sclerotialus]|uniref:hypothetical protein n=1 Tax=Streptomyces sclerotialus TaxID=1957 RepID=UPI0004C8C4FC
MRSIRRGRRAAAIAVLSGTLLVPFGASAFADEPAPGSGRGGSPGPSAPAGYQVTTELPQRIMVDNESGKTSLTAGVTNKAGKATGAMNLLVVGFGGMEITGVKGCSPVAADKRPEGSNSAFSCAIDRLDAGKSRTYDVSATFDLKKRGKICLPVLLGNTKTLLWQQGPVDFGTTKPTPDAPDTPLLLGTANVPTDSPASPSPPAKPPEKEPEQGREKEPAEPPEKQLPETGAPVLPLAGIAAALLTAGGAGMWLTSRRAGR